MKFLDVNTWNVFISPEITCKQVKMAPVVT